MGVLLVIQGENYDFDTFVILTFVVSDFSTHSSFTSNKTLSSTETDISDVIEHADICTKMQTENEALLQFS